MTPAAEIFEPMPLRGVGVELRAARFPAEGVQRGVLVLLNGQTEFIEKYFEVIDELRGRGFAVATFDWRGQGGSQRLLADDSRKGFVGDFAEYDDDLETFLNWVVTPMLQAGEKPVALAHSMGAHILLRHLVKKPGSFRAASLTAPMIAISFRGQAEMVVRLVTALQTRFNRKGWVWGMKARDPHAMTFATQMVTSDSNRFDRTQAILRDEPELRLAGATWSWLAAALRSMDWLKKQAPRITTPLLVVGAGADRICITPAARAFAAHCPDAVYEEIAGAGHEILMEQDAFRAQWWAAFDAFMGDERRA